MIENFDDLRDKLIDDNPLHDTFRRWTAPFDGDIAISGDVILEDTSSERAKEQYETADGVRVAIQHMARNYGRRSLKLMTIHPKPHKTWIRFG